MQKGHWENSWAEKAREQTGRQEMGPALHLTTRRPVLAMPTKHHLHKNRNQENRLK